MSDSEGDFSDELLELAGASDEKKRKRRLQKRNGLKRKRTDSTFSDDADDNSPESQDADDAPAAGSGADDDEDLEDVNLYPLEGKYKDEHDREELLALPELEREELISQRLEHLQRAQDKRALELMVRAQRGGKADDDAVSKAAKRAHAVRGATKEKSRKLDELKARRKAKDDKKRSAPATNRDDGSPEEVDMEMSSEDDDEEGLITKEDLDDERFERTRRAMDRTRTTKPDADEPAPLEEVKKCIISRMLLAKHCMKPWFEEYVTGGYVRYCRGRKYYLCEIVGLGEKPKDKDGNVITYKLENERVDQTLKLQHGKGLSDMRMDNVSNGEVTEHEWARLLESCKDDKVSPPMKRSLDRKLAQLTRLLAQPLTEADLEKMLEKRRKLQGAETASTTLTGPALTLERARLTQARTLAQRRNDWAEVKQLDEQLALLQASAPIASPVKEEEETVQQRIARVHEKNRKAEIERVRRMEAEAAERKRMRRKLEREGRASAPGSPSRPGTPVGKPISAAASPLPSSALSTAAPVTDDIEVDLGDF